VTTNSYCQHFTLDQVRVHAKNSGDMHPLHLGEDPIVHGSYVLSYIVGVVFSELGAEWMLQSLDSKFVRPIKINTDFQLQITYNDDAKRVLVGYELYVLGELHCLGKLLACRIKSI
jgi:acyl dehydratase